jgi:hypothetical protein
MHRHDEDPIGSLVIAIEQKHPRPRAQHESSRGPPSPQFRTGQRKGFKNPQRADDPTPGISGKPEPRDGVIHVPLRSRADNYLRHSGQLVKRYAFPPPRLGKSLLGALPSTGNAVENLRDPAGIRICIVQRSREERPGKRPLLHVRPLSKPCEFARVSFVQGDVYALRIDSHKARIAQIYTTRACSLPLTGSAPGWIRTSDRRIRSSAGRCLAGRLWPDRADHVQGVRLSSLELGTNFGTKFSSALSTPAKAWLGVALNLCDPARVEEQGGSHDSSAERSLPAGP